MFIKKIIAYFLAEKALPSNAVLIDVRSPFECSGGIVEGSLTIPLADLSNNKPQNLEIAKIDKSQPIVVYCASGGRAVRAKKLLESMGFQQVYNGASVQNVARKLSKNIIIPDS